jgi:hypothetical protein
VWSPPYWVCEEEDDDEEQDQDELWIEATVANQEEDKGQGQKDDEDHEENQEWVENDTVLRWHKYFCSA